ncbi:hypothetical protein HPB50_000400 [Hyalomma asiaticum]|uniref:Uncharacterized protein n=1 Tax=Hyalomma asiaticum TaxID=266040 RepID=A0ACB7TAB7_HYAAI|nr:hypothetical protein HPB50_000400 [Hyalomma asiaticum]
MADHFQETTAECSASVDEIEGVPCADDASIMITAARKKWCVIVSECLEDGELSTCRDEGAGAAFQITQSSCDRPSELRSTQETPSHMLGTVQNDYSTQDRLDQCTLGLSPELLAKLDTPEWCGCSVENWASFKTAKARPIIRNELFSYNYVLLPELIIWEGTTAVQFRLYAFESLSESPNGLPAENKLEIHCMHASDSTKDMVLCVEVFWEKQHPSVLLKGEEVRFVGHITHCVSTSFLEAGGFIEGDRFKVMFKVTS